MQGDVLEVSAGTGRNVPYYQAARIRSLTLTDSSRNMLVNAADKYAALAQGGAAVPPVRFELADAQRLVDVKAGGRSAAADGEQQGQAQQRGQQQQQHAPEREPGSPQRPVLKERRTFPPHSFDVVVDTFGLCSQDDPVTALKASLGLVVWRALHPLFCECSSLGSLPDGRS
jgi:methyltransferase OMS1